MIALDALVDRVVAASEPAAIAAARADFEARGGAFAPEDAFFEERMRAAQDFALVEWGAPRGALALAWAAHAAPAEAEAARALPRALRGLFRVEVASEADDRVRVTELLGGAPFRLAPDGGVTARLRPGDRFDGRIVRLAGAVRVLPGIVFHPAEAHAALDELCVHARAARRAPEPVLDGLLRMRMRFDRFTGMHARHVYRWDAIDRTEILAASWARPKG